MLVSEGLTICTAQDTEAGGLRISPKFFCRLHLHAAEQCSDPGSQIMQNRDRVDLAGLD